MSVAHQLWGRSLTFLGRRPAPTLKPRLCLLVSRWAVPPYWAAGRSRAVSPAPCPSVSSWLWISCHGSCLWLRTKMNPLSLEISSFRPVSVTLLHFLRPVSFREVLFFHERVFVGLHRGPVPLCNCLAIFVPLVITSRSSPAEAVAAAPREAPLGIHTQASLPVGWEVGAIWMEGRSWCTQLVPWHNFLFPLTAFVSSSLLMQTARVAWCDLSGAAGLAGS